MDEALQEFAEKAIKDRVFPGCVIGVVRQNGARAVLPLGCLTYEPDAPLVTEHTIYDLASITKSIPVASLALMLIAEGKLSLSDSIKKFIPELQNHQGASIEDILRYRVTGVRMSTLPFKTFEEIRTHIFEQGLSGRAEASAYANVPAFLLGIVLERVSGEILPVLAHHYFFEPLGMNDTTFFPHDIERCAPTEIVDDKEIRGIVHDESARIFSRARRAVGHAGLFSTAPDLLKFLEAMLNRKLSPIVEGAQKGSGWEVDRDWMGEKRSAKTFGKTGFTGTSILCDIERGIGLIILSNRTFPRRPPDNAAINAFRKDIADIIIA